MSAQPATRVLRASLAAGGLWLLVAAVRGMLSQVAAGLAALGTVIPDVVPLSVWLWPGAWPAATVIIGAVAVAACHALYTAVVARDGSASVVGSWFAAVAAGATVGLAFDIAAGLSSVMIVGPRGLLGGEFGATAAAGALWGLVVGWMPGLLAVRRSPRAATSPVRRSWFAATAGLAVVAVIAAAMAGNDAQRAFYEAAAQEEAARQHEAADRIGAVPDPAAQGDPVPAEAAASAPLDARWCTAERATLLLGASDAATGHRIQSVELMNFSDAPCVVEGYPDIAFGDQNDHLLDVTIERGSSFMASDPGPQRIEVPAGGSAVASLGWDAASTHGALVGATLWAAPVAGMTRGSWPVELDIVEGATVAVTAWRVQNGPAGGEG
ncbi:DUF4232 domain-containing protein [Microbacterium yannicii]|uniref:DUF4232 domain-containing protein n=1 Tax=Microbacterium yannicii TaxID=671622 RepID=UPI000318AF30|nr:DUF4232 domain-containing protein [Microbacterium yannicii]